MDDILKKCVQLWINYSKGYFSESDRSNLIIGCAVLDEWLKVCILESHSDKIKIITKLIDYPGPLSSFAARIDYFYLQGYLLDESHWALHKIRSLRNIMAHESGDLSFDSASIQDKIEERGQTLNSD